MEPLIAVRRRLDQLGQLRPYPLRQSGKRRVSVNGRQMGLRSESRERYEGVSMITALYIAAAVIMAVVSLYLAWRNRDFRKFLAGAFFVSSGILFYLYLADVSVPLLGDRFCRKHPRSAVVNPSLHFILFLVYIYFGFVRKPRA